MVLQLLCRVLAIVCTESITAPNGNEESVTAQYPFLSAPAEFDTYDVSALSVFTQSQEFTHPFKVNPFDNPAPLGSKV